MKNFKKIVFFVCSTTLSLHALEGELKIRGGAFIPQSKLFRCIYGKAAGIVEIEGAISVCNNAQLWANFDWLSKCGKSIGFCNPTSIQMPSFSFGLKAPFEYCDWLSFYLGLGANFSLVRLKNNSICGCECIKKNSVGLVVKSGFDFDIGQCFFVDLFADYVYQPAKFQQCVNVGGLRLGLGLGRRF